MAGAKRFELLRRLPSFRFSGPDPSITWVHPHTENETKVSMERMTGIEPACSAWKADILPLNYIRISPAKSRRGLVIHSKIRRLECALFYHLSVRSYARPVASLTSYARRAFVLRIRYAEILGERAMGDEPIFPTCHRCLTLRLRPHIPASPYSPVL